MAPTQKTPFAEVTCFRTDKTLDATEIPDLKHLEQYLTERLPSPNLLYAFKITGKFAYIKTRSVPRQARPYPPLAEAAKRRRSLSFVTWTGLSSVFHPRFPGRGQRRRLPLSFPHR